jgi:hypothetical protein
MKDPILVTINTLATDTTEHPCVEETSGSTSTGQVCGGAGPTVTVLHMVPHRDP